MAPRPIVIGLTGNIATGKSTVGHMLESMGAALIDADTLAHDVMKSGSKVYEQIVERFDPLLDGDGEIDRRWLGAIVFADVDALRDLEAIVHPAVIAETERRISSCEQAVCVVEAIKLIESGMAQTCDTVWVVTAPREVQLRRLTETRGLTSNDAALRIEAQPVQEAKVALADHVIDNAGSLEALRQQVSALWKDVVGRLSTEEGGALGEKKGWLLAMQRDHPRLLNWLVLSVGMVILFLIMSAGKGLALGHTLGLTVMCVLLAGACTLIISWE